LTPSPPASRRTLLRAAGALTAAATALVPGAACADGGAAHPAASGSGTPGRAGELFDLGAPATALFTGVPLHDATVLQSFAFDDLNRRVYAVQLMAGGQALPGEPAPVSGAQRAADGDLCLTQLGPDGAELGHMYLLGFGHGVQLGVQPVGRTAYLWTEVASDNYGGANGWGQRLARFAFTDGAVLTAGSPQVRQYTLIPGTDHTTVAVDAAHRRLTMRYARDGAFRYAVFPLDAVGRSGVPPVADIAQPALPATFQGFTSYGRWLYLLTGDAYGANGSTAPTGDTRISRVDLGAGAVAEEVPVTAAPDLVYREPEGMAVRLAGPGRPQLCFGFASGVVGDRRASVFALPAVSRSAVPR
jgi:receptor-binding protein